MVGFCIILAIVLSNNFINITHVSNIPIDDYGIEVSVQDYNGLGFSLFLTRELQLTSLQENLIAGDETATVVNSTNCLVGDALDLYDDDYYFQSIILDVTGNVITFTPPTDYDFMMSNTVVKCGEWNHNVDGSVTPIEYYVRPPRNRSWDIESIALHFVDNSDWDISSFGSRTALTNGFTVSIKNNITRELFLIYNNGGFVLRGGELTNFEKAPSGSFGFNVDLEFATKYGNVVKLDGVENERFISTIRDDLTTQQEIAFVVRGHYKDE